MGKHAASLALLLGLILIISARADADVELKAGLGYDYFSQQYFLDSTLGAEDSALAIWSLSNDYLDELKGLVSLTYRPSTDSRTSYSLRWEQTNEFTRLRTLNEIFTPVGRGRLSLSGELDWRKRIADTAQFGDSYLFGSGRAGLSLPVFGAWSAVAQLSGEFVRFDSVSGFNYNYHRLGGRLGIERQFADFSFADARLFLFQRSVPDSALLDYLSAGLESSYLGFYSMGDLDLYTRLEFRDYNRADESGDYFRAALSARNSLYFGGQIFSRQTLEFDLTNYGPDDPVNRDFYQLKLILLTGLEPTPVSIAIGPAFDFVSENRETADPGYSYSEFGGQLVFEYMDFRWLFLSLESTTGIRNLRDNDSLFTDYTFQRVNLLSNLSISDNMELNTIFSAEWEWHDIETNNSRIYLVSTSLTYTF